MQNFFNTLNQALEAENITHMWDAITMGGISYGETKRFTYDDNTRDGHFVSIYRDERGMYERPIHYARGSKKKYPKIENIKGDVADNLVGYTSVKFDCFNGVDYRTWITKHCKGDVLIHPARMYFTSKADATFFKLTF